MAVAPDEAASPLKISQIKDFILIPFHWFNRDLSPDEKARERELLCGRCGNVSKYPGGFKSKSRFYPRLKTSHITRLH